MFAFGCWAGIKMFLNEKGACQNDMKTVSLQFYGFASWTGKERFVLLTGPVPECLRLVHGKELPVPKGWNSLVANVGTTGYHCKELPVPRGWNAWFPTWEPEVTIATQLPVPNLGTTGYHCKELPVPKGWN